MELFMDSVMQCLDMLSQTWNGFFTTSEDDNDWQMDDPDWDWL